MVFHISSNHDGTQIALSSIDKSSTRKWDFYLFDKDMQLTPFNANPDVVFENNFSFIGTEDGFVYVGYKDGKHSLWKGNFSTDKPEKIFETEKYISYPHVLKSGEVYFISENLVIKNQAGWDWFRFSPQRGVEKITNNNYYYFKKPFMLEESVMGFVQRYSFAQFLDADDPRIGKPYLETLALNPSTKSEAMLKALQEYVDASNSESEQAIQCDAQGNICIADHTFTPGKGITFAHEFFMIEPTGSKKLDIRLSWGERFTLSGNGKHLFIVGTHGARSEEYFLHKYSRNADGDFVFAEEKDLFFVKNKTKS